MHAYTHIAPWPPTLCCFFSVIPCNISTLFDSLIPWNTLVLNPVGYFWREPQPKPKPSVVLFPSIFHQTLPLPSFLLSFWSHRPLSGSRKKKHILWKHWKRIQFPTSELCFSWDLIISLWYLPNKLGLSSWSASLLFPFQSFAPGLDSCRWGECTVFLALGHPSAF